MSQTELLARAASLAAWSRHPLALALCDRLTTKATASWHHIREEPGAGIEARDAQGRRWRLGSPAWVGRIGVVAPPSADDGRGPVAWFGLVGEPLLGLYFEETVRAGVPQALADLQAEGLQITMLSGDTPARVQHMAQTLSLAAMGGATPEMKLTAVRAAQARGERVAMLGDGINDAPVLAQADVSLAMGAGALLARSQADAVLLANRLADVVELRRLSCRCVRVIRQNIAWAAGYNALCVPLALAGLLPPWAAGIGMAGSSLFVVCNALRLRR